MSETKKESKVISGEIIPPVNDASPALAAVLEHDPATDFLKSFDSITTKRETLSTTIHPRYAKMLKKYFSKRGATADFIDRAIECYLQHSKVAVDDNGKFTVTNQTKLEL